VPGFCSIRREPMQSRQVQREDERQGDGRRRWPALTRYEKRDASPGEDWVIVTFRSRRGPKSCKEAKLACANVATVLGSAKSMMCSRMSIGTDDANGTMVGRDSAAIEQSARSSTREGRAAALS
jgi:hypothetical protein